MKAFGFMILTALFLLGFSAHAAQIREYERGYEIDELRVVMTGNSGRVIVRECDSCPDVTLRITQATRVFKGEQEIPLQHLIRYRGQAGVVFQDHQTDEVTRIRIY